MRNLLRRLKDFIADPFGTRKIIDTHDKIIEEMVVTKQRAKYVRISRFPIADNVGNPRLRRREQYAHR